MLRHHDGAERARIRIKNQVVAERAFARDPEPVRQHEVRGTALERDLAGLGAGEFGYVDIEIGLLVEAVSADDLQLPRQRSGLLRAMRMRSAATACEAANPSTAASAIRKAGSDRILNVLNWLMGLMGLMRPAIRHCRTWRGHPRHRHRWHRHGAVGLVAARLDNDRVSAGDFRPGDDDLADHERVRCAQIRIGTGFVECDAGALCCRSTVRCPSRPHRRPRHCAAGCRRC